MSISLYDSNDGRDFRKILGEKLTAQRERNGSHELPLEWMANDAAVQRIGHILDKAKEAVDIELSQCEDSSRLREGQPTFAARIEHYIFAIAKELDEYCIGENTGFINVWKESLKDSELFDAIKIRLEPDRVIIHLPFMFLKYGGNHDPLARLLAEKISTCPCFPQWTHWHASFIHSHALSRCNRARDVDNYNYWKIIDVIAQAMNTSDSPTRFDMDATSYFSNDHPTGCYVVIRPKSSDFYHITPIELLGLDIFDRV